MTRAQLGRILVVDDEAELRAVLSEKLAHQGYDVVSCAGAAEALEVLQGQNFDILLTDLMMPEMDGVALLRGALQIDPHLGGIIMTGQATVQTAVEALQIGALDFILKPFKTPALLPVLSRALEVRRLRLDNVQLREAVAIDELCKAIAFTTDLNTILNKLADGALQQCDADEASIMLPTADEKELCIRAIKGADRGALLGERVPIDQGIAGWVARARAPLTLEGEIQDTRFVPVRPRADIRAAVSMPMLVGGKLVGILNVNSTRRRQPYTLGQVKALGILASAGAAAIEGALLVERLRESETRFRSIFENAVEGICRTTPAGELRAVNPAFARMLGYDSADELIASGTNAQQLYENLEDRARICELLERQGTIQGYETRFLRRDRQPVWVSLNARSVPDQNTGEVVFDCTAEDITARKRAEDILREKEEQLRQAQRMEAIGQLAAGVAHDFNNLLTIINGYSELLIRDMPPDNPSRTLLEEIRNAGERSAVLTRQLLVFSRKQVVAPRVLDLNEVVADAEKLLRRLIGEDVRLTVTRAAGLGTITADPGHIEQVLLNLAINARDAMPRGGALTIETKISELDEEFTRAHVGVPPGRYAQLVVSDTGCGMTPDVMSRIFEPFFTTKGLGKGTGLGLATVFGIVKQAEGTIEVHSEPGVGTTFKVYLPRTDKPVPSGNSLSSIKTPPRGTETVLLVEDEEGVRALTRHVLAGSGYSVIEAANGEEALRIVAGQPTPVHLLVTDVVMPRLGGRELAEQLLARYPDMKILFLSGYTDDAVVRHGVLHAEVNFLQKPFSPSALAHKVREVLDAGPGVPGFPAVSE